jgi:multicomponent K+:H+ antiporter subunit D
MAAMTLALPEVTGAALLYLASSTLGAAALFLMVELVERGRQLELEPPSADEREDRLLSFGEAAPRDANLDDRQVALVGRAIPASMAFLGVGFLLCTLVLAGLPPLSGFVGKVAMIDGLLRARDTAGPFPLQAWVLFAILIVSGLLAAVAFTRAFIAHFWALQDRAAPRLRVIESVSVGLLLAACMALAMQGDRALGYLRGAAEQLHDPRLYIRAVMGSQPVPSPIKGQP